MPDWLDRLDVELDNLGVALEWGLEAAPEPALRMCDALFQYWRLRVAAPDSEARMLRAIDVARRIAAGPPEPTTAQLALAGRSLGHIALIWGMTGRPAEAAGWARDGLALARASGDRAAVMVALQSEIYVTVFGGAGADPQPLADEALALATEAEDWDALATGSAMASAGLVRTDLAAAEKLAARADSAASRTGNPFTIAVVALGHGRMLGNIGRADEAREQLQRAIDRLTELGDQRLILSARSELGHALRRAGRLEEAEAVYREAVRGWVRLGNRGAVANILEQSAFIEIDRRHERKAAQLLGAAETIREGARAPMAIYELSEYQPFVQRLRSQAPGKAVEAAWQAGRAMTLPDAVDLAVSTGLPDGT
jgi:tetratricopeptide (TPR) repeat protein